MEDEVTCKRALLGLVVLLVFKYVFNLSDYVIPGLPEIWTTGSEVSVRYIVDVIDTLLVAIIGHILSICMATVVGIIGRLTNLAGVMIKIAAYNLQAYPIVAVAPIIFILLV